MEELIKDYQDITLTENEVAENAKNSIRTLSEGLLKTKAYYNALAASAVMKFFEEKGLIRGEIVNIHASSKMLVEFEIADIQLPNLHIDVRAVFDENLIFIPKKHFEHKLLPDIYLVMKFDEDLMNGTLLGFVEPSQINKQNQNEEYYFVNYSALTSPSKLVDFIKSRPVKTQYPLTEAGEDAVEKLIMLFMDHDIDTLKLDKLLDYLKNSLIAREKLIEFENFERLSYMALKEFKNLDVENNDFTRYIKTLVATDEFAQFEDKEDDLSNLFDEETNKSAGLFVDDDLAEAQETAEPVPVADEVVEEEDLPLEKGVTEPVTIEEEPVKEEVLDAAQSVIEEITPDVEAQVEEIQEPAEVEPAPVVEELQPVDEFDAFEEKDEFDEVDEFSTEETVTEEASPEDSAEPVVDLENLVLDEEISTEPLEIGDSVSLDLGELEETSVEEPVVEDVSTVEELPLEEETTLEAETTAEESATEPQEEAVVEDESVITEDDILDVTETIEKPLESEDLELHVEGLEGLSEDFAASTEETVELSEENIGEISLETEEIVPEEISAPQESVEEQPNEPEDVETLDLESVSTESVSAVTEELPEFDNLEELNLSEEPTVLEETASTEELVLDNLEESIEEPTVAEETPTVEETPLDNLEELETVEEPLAANETTEEPILDNLEELEPVQEAENTEELSFDDLDALNFDEPSTEEEKPSETETTEVKEDDNLLDFVESVSDEDVEKAIAQSQETPVEEKQESDTVDLSDLDGLISDSGSSDEMSLEELLAIENDLSGEPSQGGGRGFRMDDDEEAAEKAAPKSAAVAASAEELAMLSAGLEEDAQPVISDNTPKIDEVEEDGGSDFAFAVDSKPQGAGKKLLIPAVALAAVLGIAGTGAWYFLSHKTTNTVDISNVGGGGGGGFDLNSMGSDNEPAVKDTAPATKETAQTPAVTDIQVPSVPADENVSSATETVTMQKIKKDFSQPNTYLSVERIVWDIPEYLTYNDDFNGYLQTLGSTIKRNVSTDLLLVNENPIYDRVRVRIQLKESGKKYSAEIVDGCGTKTIDDLVLQSVKSTLNLLQPPVNSLDTADEDLYLTLHL